MNFFVKRIHVFSLKWRFESAHLIKHASKGPNVTFIAVGIVVPDFGAGIVRSSCLGIGKVFVHEDRNIHVANFWDVIFPKENVGWLQISVDDFGCVKGFETLENASSDGPDLKLVEVLAVFVLFLDKALNRKK